MYVVVGRSMLLLYAQYIHTYIHTSKLITYYYVHTGSYVHSRLSATGVLDYMYFVHTYVHMLPMIPSRYNRYVSIIIHSCYLYIGYVVI